MNNKVLVEISVPAASQKFDVILALDCKMSEVALMASKALAELSNDTFKASEQSVLCDAATGRIFNINKEVAELGIKNGTRLVLI